MCTSCLWSFHRGTQTAESLFCFFFILFAGIVLQYVNEVPNGLSPSSSQFSAPLQQPFHSHPCSGMQPE